MGGSSTRMITPDAIWVHPGMLESFVHLEVLEYSALNQPKVHTKDFRDACSTHSAVHSW